MAATEVTPLIMDANTVTTIVNNINSLYSNAISQLTSYTFGVVAVVGILMPIIVSVIQSKSLKTEKENLEKYISDEVSKIKSTLRDEISSELKLLVEAEENELFSRVDVKFKTLEDKLKCAHASSFHIQGRTHLSQKFYLAASEDFCEATIGYLTGGDELNGQRTLRLLVNDCLTKLHKEDYENGDLDTDLESLLVALNNINIHNRYTDQIANLNRERKAGKSRISEKTPPK